ncbi:MAG: phosphatase PAP2 family protein [Rubrivivax sp.]|nr:phosphatase PAP2 family protein [Rubrivivax sp.]
MRVDRRAAALALLALLPLALWELLGTDLAAARLFGTAAGFALRSDWWLSAVLHDGVRDAAWALALLLGLNILVPLTPALARSERIWWFAATLAGAAMVPLVKQQSLTSCPWDLAEFGGLAQHLPHWLQFRPFGLADGGGGHCFPSGHATSAFCFFSGSFALARAHPRAARRWTWGVLAAGLLLGLVQLARGAHFPSHTLWSGWLCFSLNLVLARWLPQPAAPTPAAGHAQRLALGANVFASDHPQRPTA